MKKDTFFIKVIKHFYGITELDEYSLSVINQLGNQLFMGLFAYFGISQVIFWFIITKNPEIGGISMIGLNTLVLFLIIPTIISMTIRRKGLFRGKAVDPKDLPKTRQKQTVRALLAGLFFTFWMFFVILIMKWWINGIAFSDSIQNPDIWGRVGISGLFFTLAMIYSVRKKVIVETDQD